MNSPVGWFLPAIAALAAALAIWAGPNLTIALPAAAIATLAAGLLFVEAGIESRNRRLRRSELSWQPELFRLRSAIRSGPLGREELVTTLDRVERAGPAPDLPARAGAEMEAIVGLPASEFRRYLRTRLDDLEARV
jgi:hypothetical protein